eukprot:487640-Pyramimonas_sp.AAC.1
MSSDLWIQRANAPNHSECDRRAHQLCSYPTARVSGPSSAHRPSSDLWISQANASIHSERDSCAYQLCSCPTAR